MDMYRLIKLIRLDDIVPESTIEELKKYAGRENFEEGAKFIFDKSERIGELYQNVDDLLVDFWTTDDFVPEKYRYFDEPGGSSSHPEGIPREYKDQNGQKFISRHDFLLAVYNIFKKEKVALECTSPTKFEKWLDFFINQKYENLENTYELIPFSVFKSLKKTAKKIDCFEVEEVLKIHDKFKEQFEPTKNPLPIIRCFNWGESAPSNKFYFKKEVMQAVKILREEIFREFDEAESLEERKLGLVHLMNEPKFSEILEIYDISKNEFSLVMVRMFCYANENVSPIISNFGTFCKPAKDAFKEVILYLIRNMQLFDGMEKLDFQTVLRWIRTNLSDFLVKSDKLYAIEVWRIEEIIEKAKNDLKIFKKSPKSKLPSRDSYTKSEILDYIQKLMNLLNVKISMETFEARYEKNAKKKICTKHGFYSILNACLDQLIVPRLGDLFINFQQQDELSKMEVLKENSLEEQVTQILQSSGNFTLTPFKTAKSYHIYKLKKLLLGAPEKFDEKQLFYLTNVIFKDFGRTRDFFKNLEHLYIFEEKCGELLFSRRAGDSESIRLMEMEEMDRISDKTRLENSKLRSILDAIQGQLKELRISKEDEKKLHQEEISLKNGEILKISENLENSTKTIRQLQKENLKIKEDYQKYEKKYAEDMKGEIKRKNNDLKNELNLVKNSKIEVEKMLVKTENDLVSAEKSKHNLENQLESAKHLQNEIAKRLEKAENDLVSAEVSKKNLENQLKSAKNEKSAIENQLKNVENDLSLAETSRKNMENELNLARSKIENNLVLPETSKLIKENKKLREKVLKRKKMETWFENKIERMDLVSKNHEKLRNYERISKITHEEIFSNLNKLLQKFPNNTEIFRARNQIFKSADFEENMEILREQVWRIQENPEGEFEEIPFIHLMEKYEQWIEEYL